MNFPHAIYWRWLAKLFSRSNIPDSNTVNRNGPTVYKQPFQFLPLHSQPGCTSGLETTWKFSALSCYHFTPKRRATSCDQPKVICSNIHDSFQFWFQDNTINFSVLKNQFDNGIQISIGSTAGSKLPFSSMIGRAGNSNCIDPEALGDVCTCELFKIVDNAKSKL